MGTGAVAVVALRMMMALHCTSTVALIKHYVVLQLQETSKMSS